MVTTDGKKRWRAEQVEGNLYHDMKQKLDGNTAGFIGRTMLPEENLVPQLIRPTKINIAPRSWGGKTAGGPRCGGRSMGQKKGR